MSDVAPAPARGSMSGQNIIGEVTESIHKFMLDHYDLTERVPRFEEDLSFVPKDREEVIYIYMYRASQNPNLRNAKRFRQAPVYVKGKNDNADEVFYHRPPLLMDLFYLIGVHSKFRSDAERLLGWVMLTLNEATHLLYRPRKFNLPDGRIVDSIGRPYDAEADQADDDLYMEKVSLAMVDDLTVGDAINFFSIQEAPYRPFLTYRARVAMDGPLVAGDGGTTIRIPRIGRRDKPADSSNPTSPSGRVMAGKTGSIERPTIGPDPINPRKVPEDESATNNETEE